MASPPITDALGPAAVRLLELYLDVDRLMALVRSSPVEIQLRFREYVAEALFFRQLLRPAIGTLIPGNEVIEIGSGIGLLARLIAAEGDVHVTAYEPESGGFGSMHAISEMLQACWRGEPANVTFVPTAFPISSDVNAIGANLIVAVNVIEHASDPGALVAAATRSLAPGGTARFICPNSDFPYEAHFGIPTLIDKRLTHWFARPVIRRSAIHDSEQFWKELSWPSVRSLNRALRAPDIDLTFSRAALQHYLSRIDDDEFVARKGPPFQLLVRTARPLVKWAAGWVPLSIAPVIDLTTRRRSTP